MNLPTKVGSLTRATSKPSAGHKWPAGRVLDAPDVRSRKQTMLQKGIITFNPTYLIKGTHISSILKFLNTESLMVQVSNTRFNIQVYTSEPNQ